MTSRRLRDSAVLTAGLLSLGVTFAAPGHAIEGCGVGLYFNNVTGQCQPWAPAGVGFVAAAAAAAAVPVAAAVLDPIPLGIGFDPLPLGIGFDPWFGLNVPNIAPFLRVPDFGIPGLHVPGVPDWRGPLAPDLRVPDLRVPDVRVPDLRVPDVRVPDVRVPDVRVPDVHIGRR